MSAQPITLDMSTAQPLAPVKLDMSTAQPIAQQQQAQPSTGERLTRSYNPDVEAFAEKHPILGLPARALDAAGGAALNFLPSIYHAFTDPLTPEEEANFKGHTRIPGEVILERLSGAEAGVGAAKDYLNGKVSPGAALSVLPEALGQGVGNVAAGVTAGKTGSAALSLAKDRAAAIAPDLYRSALKPSTVISAPKAASIIETGLQNSIPVSESGAAKLQRLMQEYDNARAAVISSDPTRPISTAQVANRVSEPIRRFSNQVNPYDDLNAINNARDEFIASQPATIDAAKAQELKTGTYAQLGSKAYGEMKTASVEAQKALARGLKEELNSAFPELADINKSEARLYDLQPVLERALNRIGNHQLMGIGTPLTGTAAKAVTGSSVAGAVASAMKLVLDNPTVKSKLAISLSKAGVPYTTAQTRIGNYLGSLGAGAASQVHDELAADRASE